MDRRKSRKIRTNTQKIETTQINTGKTPTQHKGRAATTRWGRNTAWKRSNTSFNSSSYYVQGYKQTSCYKLYFC